MIYKKSQKTKFVFFQFLNIKKMCVGTDIVCHCCKRNNGIVANFTTCKQHVLDVKNSTKNCSGIVLTNIASTCYDCLVPFHLKNCRSGIIDVKYLKPW